MTDLINKDRAIAATTEIRPETRPSRRPKPGEPKPKPNRLIRFIELTAFVVGFAAAAILALYLAGRGGTDAALVPEHGDFTQAFIRDTSGHDRSGYVAVDPPNLDPDVFLEHGEFTKAVLVDRSALDYPLHVAIDPPNLDPDEVEAPEHGEFTDPFVRDTTGHTRSGFAGTDPPNLDPD